MLEALLLAALLSVSDPASDALGADLGAPSAAAFRAQGVFDLRRLEVLESDTLALTLTLGRVGNSFPQAIIELYLSDAEVTGSSALLPGSAMQLPTGASWRYAVQIIGTRARLFEAAPDGGVTDITEAGSAALTVAGNTLTFRADVALPRRFSLYGMSGSYDPFSPDGWRRLRDAPAPWGFTGDAPSPALDIVAEDAQVQAQALAQGVLPEIRASFAQPGWLAVAGMGVLVALAGVAARFTLGRQPALLPPAPHLAPFPQGAVRERRRALKALAQGRATLLAPPRKDTPVLIPADVEPTDSAEADPPDIASPEIDEVDTEPVMK